MTEPKKADLLKTSEGTFQLAYHRAKEISDFKGGFLMRTAHELRSPLNKIISLQQMILEGLCDSPEEEQDFVSEAYAASLKLLEYLDLLIRVSKIEMGRLKPQRGQVALAPVFEQVREMTHLQVRDRNLRLTVEVPDTSVYAYTDSAWLCNLLIGLVELAVDQGDRGTLTLRLSPSEEGPNRRIWLEDDRLTSPWQEPPTLPDLPAYDPEDRLSPSLRMALMDAMITALGGTLAVLSVCNGQTPTRLELTLPAQPSS